MSEFSNTFRTRQVEHTTLVGRGTGLDWESNNSAGMFVSAGALKIYLGGFGIGGQSYYNNSQDLIINFNGFVLGVGADLSYNYTRGGVDTFQVGGMGGFGVVLFGRGGAVYVKAAYGRDTIGDRQIRATTIQVQGGISGTPGLTPNFYIQSINGDFGIAIQSPSSVYFFSDRISRDESESLGGVSYISDQALVYLGDPAATSRTVLGGILPGYVGLQSTVSLSDGAAVPVLQGNLDFLTQDSIQRFLNETSSTEHAPDATTTTPFAAPSGSVALESPGVTAVLGMTGGATIGAESAIAQDYANASVGYSATYTSPSDMNFRIDDSYYYYEYPDFSSVEYAYNPDYSNIDINAGYGFSSSSYYAPDVYSSSQNSGSGYSYNGYFDSSTGYYSAGVSISFPVVLDLNGDGVSITERTASNTYRDVNGDGTEHRTAWAAAGDGVLVYDYTGTGDVDSPQAFQFTTWDPTATSDMQARG